MRVNIALVSNGLAGIFFSSRANLAMCPLTGFLVQTCSSGRLGRSFYQDNACS